MDPLDQVRALDGRTDYDLDTWAQVLQGFQQSTGTHLVLAALLVAARAHSGQMDKSGQPYILHPVRVMRYAPSDETHQAAALLHDVVEDTTVTPDDLRRWGFPEPLLEVLDHLTHRAQEPYLDYVRRCMQNPVAKQVKYADLRDNMSPARQRMLGEGSVRLMERYQKALEILDAAP